MDRGGNAGVEIWNPKEMIYWRRADCVNAVRLSTIFSKLQFVGCIKKIKNIKGMLQGKIKTENLFDSGTFVLCLDHTNMCTDILADNCTNIVANICMDMLANISCIFVNYHSGLEEGFLSLRFCPAGKGYGQ